MDHTKPVSVCRNGRRGLAELAGHPYILRPLAIVEAIRELRVPDLMLTTAHMHHMKTWLMCNQYALTSCRRTSVGSDGV